MEKAFSGAVVLFFIGLFLFFKFGPAIPISMVTTTKTEMFTVTGEGKATAVPDLAQVTLGITSTAGSVTEAQSRANSVINKISADLKKLGVGENDIKTNSYNLRRDYQNNNLYVAEVNLLVKLHKFDQLDQAIDIATKDGANQIGGLYFTLDDATQEKLEADARKIAIANAKKKAAEIAKESGITLGRIINVSEGSGFSPRPMYAVAEKAMGVPADTTQIQPGSSEITISVTLSFETR